MDGEAKANKIAPTRPTFPQQTPLSSVTGIKFDGDASEYQCQYCMESPATNKARGRRGVVRVGGGLPVANCGDGRKLGTSRRCCRWRVHCTSSSVRSLREAQRSRALGWPRLERHLTCSRWVCLLVSATYPHC